MRKGQREGSRVKGSGPFCLQGKTGSLLQQVIRKQFLFQPLMGGSRILMLSCNYFFFLSTKLHHLVGIWAFKRAVSEPITLICIF